MFQHHLGMATTLCLARPECQESETTLTQAPAVSAENYCNPPLSPGVLPSISRALLFMRFRQAQELCPAYSFFEIKGEENEKTTRASDEVIVQMYAARTLYGLHQARCRARCRKLRAINLVDAGTGLRNGTCHTFMESIGVLMSKGEGR